MLFKEDDDNSDDNGVGFTCWNKFDGLECKMEAIEQMPSPPKVSTPELRPLCGISQAHDGLRSLPVFSQSISLVVLVTLHFPIFTCFSFLFQFF